MNELIKDFERGVFTQAVLHGHSELDAERLAAAAVLSRIEKSEAGFAVAQAGLFEPIPMYNYTFQITDLQVDQSSDDGGTVFRAVLGSPGVDLAGQSFSLSALEEFARQINTLGIFGHAEKDHSSFRVTQGRVSGSPVTEWVKASFEDGKLWISGKIKKGFEWVIEKLPFVSLEAEIPRTNVKVSGDKKHFLGGFIKSFAFTDNPKNPLHKVY